MAQLLAPAPPGSERISQILPTVKCSNCNRPVRIADLGEHDPQLAALRRRLAPDQAAESRECSPGTSPATYVLCLPGSAPPAKSRSVATTTAADATAARPVHSVVSKRSQQPKPSRPRTEPPRVGFA
ncbi:hypothetical protein BN946_scf185014.g22 [Trametes cinnabarina]|uniref:Uncharacterized protein n=1 Tax=Pycnoporus cinnabarinus TaxID=5643 RepID=A0A060SGA8_PYCCI|nr:hypothetical protein BN946_scf185014.g22 [Trametes cinnabarina]